MVVRFLRILDSIFTIDGFYKNCEDEIRPLQIRCPGLEVIKLEYSLRLTIKHNVWLLADTCPQAASHCALF